MNKHPQGMYDARPPVHGQSQAVPADSEDQNPKRKKKDKKHSKGGPGGVQGGKTVYTQQTTQSGQTVNLDYTGRHQVRQQPSVAELIGTKQCSGGKTEQKLSSKELEKMGKREKKTLQVNIDKLHKELNETKGISGKHIEAVSDVHQHISALEHVLQRYKEIFFAGQWNDASKDQNFRPTTAPVNRFGSYAGPGMIQESQENYEIPSVEHDLQPTEVTSGRPKTAASHTSHKRKDNDNPDQQSLERRNDVLQKDNQRLKWEIQQMKDDKRITEMKLQDAERRKEELLSRLSEIAGRKLRANNPAIADLSNENRPTKLAEKYKELYDNEWTDAFAECCKTGSRETDAIGGLLDILLEAYDFCMKWSEKQSFKLTAFEKCFDSKQIPRFELSREDLAKYLRNSSSKEFASLIQNDFIERMKQKLITKPDKYLEIYCRKCAEITWYMSLQTPPVVIDKEPKHGDKINPERYVCYTVKGTKVDYVVWPACMIEQDGDLLAKGVLQPLQDDDDNETRSGGEMKHIQDDGICQTPVTRDRNENDTLPQKDKDDKRGQQTRDDKRNKQESCPNQHAHEKEEDTQGKNTGKERSKDRHAQETRM